MRQLATAITLLNRVPSRAFTLCAVCRGSSSFNCVVYEHQHALPIVNNIEIEVWFHSTIWTESFFTFTQLFVTSSMYRHTGLQYVQTLVLIEPALQYVQTLVLIEPALQYVQTLVLTEPALQYVQTLVLIEPAPQYVQTLVLIEPALQYVQTLVLIEPALQYVQTLVLRYVQTLVPSNLHSSIKST